MKQAGISAWLVHDFRVNNIVFATLVPGVPGARRWTTRRIDLFIPAEGKPTLLVSAIDAGQFEHHASLGMERRVFVSWKQWQDGLRSLLGACSGGRVAMEYAPGNTLPVVGVVDAGTVELVRSMGVEVVSSADLAQATIAAWSAEAVRQHERASAEVNLVKDDAFGMIRTAVAGGRPIHEHEVAEFMRGRFKELGLEWPDGPIVAVNEHSADPHYEPSADRPTRIKPGDWILIDLWARRPGAENIFSDITWVGYAGRQPTAEHQRVFEAVRSARDAAVELAQTRWREGRPVRGWELDEAARGRIEAAGLAHGVKHRTGHSLSPGQFVHGVGMNLDNLETHDTRLMLPGIGFTIEPGVYLDGKFGVRLEINMHVDPAKGPVVTSAVQREVVGVG